MTESQRTVTHDEEASRYVLTVDGVEAGFCAYREADGVRDFDHTVIDQDFRGQGLSGPLIKAALDDTRVAGTPIMASCSAIEHFLNKNEEYKDLLADA